MVGKLMTNKSILDFADYVCKQKKSDRPRAIEEAYGKFIVPNEHLTKAEFLKAVLALEPALFDETVNHLFTPMNWSQIKARKFFAIKDTGSGNLITINMEAPNERYTLDTCSVDDDNRPMLMTTHEEAESLMQVFDYQSRVEALLDMVADKGEDVLVSLVANERINLKNLEIVEVELVF